MTTATTGLDWHGIFSEMSDTAPECFGCGAPDALHQAQHGHVCDECMTNMLDDSDLAELLTERVELIPS